MQSSAADYTTATILQRSDCCRNLAPDNELLDCIRFVACASEYIRHTDDNGYQNDIESIVTEVLNEIINFVLENNKNDNYSSRRFYDSEKQIVGIASTPDTSLIDVEEISEQEKPIALITIITTTTTTIQDISFGELIVENFLDVKFSPIESKQSTVIINNKELYSYCKTQSIKVEKPERKRIIKKQFNKYKSAMHHFEENEEEYPIPTTTTNMQIQVEDNNEQPESYESAKDSDETDNNSFSSATDVIDDTCAKRYISTTKNQHGIDVIVTPAHEHRSTQTGSSEPSSSPKLDRETITHRRKLSKKRGQLKVTAMPHNSGGEDSDEKERHESIKKCLTRSVSSASVILHKRASLIKSFLTSSAAADLDLLQGKDKREMIVKELHTTEGEYVATLQKLVELYMIPLKSQPSYDIQMIDQIFYKVKELYMHHATLLTFLTSQPIGEAMNAIFQKETVVESYVSFIENFPIAERALDALLQRTAFQKFSDQVEKESKSKLPLKAQLVKPAQRIPRYELLLKRLLHHTPQDHCDRAGLEAAMESIHNLAVRINTVKESQAEHDLHTTVKRLENLLLTELSSNAERAYVRHDTVNLLPPSRNVDQQQSVVIWLFTDLFLVSTPKRRSSSVVRRPATLMLHALHGLSDFIDNIKHKIILRASLDAIQLSSLFKCDSEERKHLHEDVESMQQMLDICCGMKNVNENLKKMLQQLVKNGNDDLAVVKSESRLDIYANLAEGKRHMTFIFPNAEKQQSWQASFKETKNNLATQWPNLQSVPNFEHALSVRRTRAGMRLTCASPSPNSGDIWICQSDGHVTHVSLLVVHPEPIVRLTTTLPGCTSMVTCIKLLPGQPSPTMWLGDADGKLHIFPSNENIRTTKGRRQMAVGSSVTDLLVVNSQLVLVALADGFVRAVTLDDHNRNRQAQVGTSKQPVFKMVLTVHGDVWCATANGIVIIDPRNLLQQESLTISLPYLPILTLITSGSYGVWIAFDNSPILILLHSLTRQILAEINVATAVAQRLKSLQQVIRHHKLACLRITDLLTTDNQLWIATSAGVILLIALPLLAPTARPLSSSPVPFALSRGYSGSVRFLSLVKIDDDCHLVVSGGEGFENFDRPGQEDSAEEEEIGSADSLNHLILWTL